MTTRVTKQGSESSSGSDLIDALPPEHRFPPTGDPVLDKLMAERRIAAIQALPEFRTRYEPDALNAPQNHFCSDSTLLRYLEARDGDLAKASDMMDSSLKWRANKLDERELHCPACSRDSNAHCFFPIGLDSRGWQLVYSCGARAKDKNTESSIVHMSWVMEEIFNRSSEPGKIVWIIDMHGFGYKDMDTKMAKTALPMFSDHYPERMGQIVIIDPPAIFKGVWELVMPLLDPVTQRKVKLLRGDKFDYFRKYCTTPAQYTFLEAVLQTKAVPGSYPEEALETVRAEVAKTFPGAARNAYPNPAPHV